MQRGSPGSDTAAPEVQRCERAATWTFAAVVVAAVPLIGYLNRDQWFTGDEWVLLLGRRLDDPAGMLERQGDHFTTLPAVAYRLLFNAVGLHHYWPYLGLALATHLAIAVLLRLTMRRAGVHPWLATTSAGLFALFGAGWINIVHGFQITLTGSVLFGLVMLILVDRDGPLGRRDALAALAGTASVACSAVAVPMVVAVVVATWLRRGWRCAAAVGSVPAAVFVMWSVLAPAAVESSPRSDAVQTLRYAVSVSFDTAEALTRSTIGAVVLIAMLFAGIAVVVSRHADELHGRLAAPTGLLAGAVGFALVVGYTRGAPGWWGELPTDTDRYLHVLAALSLPALAVAADVLSRRWRRVLVGGIVLFVVGLPGNVELLRPAPDAATGDAATVLHLAELAEEMGSPRSMRPVLWKGAGPGLLVGPLVDARLDGKVPDPPAGSSSARDTAFLALVLRTSTDVSTRGCEPHPLSDPVTLTVDRSDRLVITSPSKVRIEAVVDGRPTGTPYAPFSLAEVVSLEVTWGPVELGIRSADPTSTVLVCR
jgi:hypothetical protein